MDPYCGWNRNKEECQTAPNKNPSVAYWQQEPLSCPVTTDPVDGGWGGWSAWFQCSYDNPDRRVRILLSLLESYSELERCRNWRDLGCKSS